VETDQIVQSLSYITWVLLGALAVGSFGLAWLLRQASDASPGFLGFSGILAGLLGLLWLATEWGLPEPSELAIQGGPGLDEPRRAAIGLFAGLALLAGVRLRRGGRAAWVGAGALLAGGLAMALAAWDWTGGDPLAVPLFVQLGALTVVTGGSLAAVVLAHWYLVTPRISERPLVLTTGILFWAIVVQLLLYGTWLATGIPGSQPFAALTGPTAVFVWLRLVVGLLFPLLLVWMAGRTARTRSMESATGLLYIEFALVMASTIVAAGLALAEGQLV
jgi:hypothetical protein